MNNLEYWLKWDDNVEYGCSGLIGTANKIYSTNGKVQEYLLAINEATEEERRKYTDSIFETLYIIAEHNDSETLTAIFECCPWLADHVIDQELLSPLDSAIEHGSLDAIDVFLRVQMYDAREAMLKAIENGNEEVVIHLMAYDMDLESILVEAITSTVTIRDVVFEHVKKKHILISRSNVVKKAMLARADLEFFRELIDICSADVFKHSFEDGRCLLDYARTEEQANLLLEKGAVLGDPVVIHLLRINGDIYRLIEHKENQEGLIEMMISTDNIEQYLYDMCHRNGEYSNWDDLLCSILKYGEFLLFERILSTLNTYKYINGEVFCAPFNFRVKWTADDWTAYDRIVRTLLAGGVAIAGNPIFEFCYHFKAEYISSLQVETQNTIINLLELFHNQGVDINQSQPSLYSYNPLACALFMGNEIGILFLLNKGVKVVSSKQEPLSFLACSRASRGYEIPSFVMKALKLSGFDINETNERGDTVLHHICRGKDPRESDFARALLYGANPLIPDKDGKLPSDIAKENGLKEILRLLGV